MSRTDKTRPHWIKGSEHPDEFHDHRDGVCDIAGVDPRHYSASKENFWRWRSGKCHFDVKWWRPEFRCGCSLCDGSGYGEGPDDINRKERRQARREAKAAVRDHSYNESHEG